MTTDRDREIAELKARLAALEGEIPSPQPEPVSKVQSASRGGLSGPQKVVFGVLIVVALIAMISQCSSPSSVSTKAPSSTAPEAPVVSEASKAAKVVAATPPAPISPWTYSETKDAMTDAVTKLACTDSTNEVSLGSPYGDVRGRLCIRRSPKFGLDSYVALNDDGQILCGISDGCTIPVRFGKAAQQRFSGSEAADYSSNIVFINNTTRMISGLRGADVTRVELQFYQAGVQSFEFDTAEFKWP
jgi:hypothetical protein